MLRKIIFSTVSLCFMLAHPVFADQQSSNMQNAASSSNCDAKSIWQKRHAMKEKMIKKLNLTDEQQDKIKQIRMQYRQQVMQDYKQKHDLRRQIMMLSMHNNVDQNALNDLLKQNSALTEKIMRSRVMMRNQMYRVLNEDQQSKMKDLMKARMDKMQHKMQQKNTQQSQS